MNRALRLEIVLRYHGGHSTLHMLILEIESRESRSLSVEEGRAWLGLRHRFTAATSELREDLERRTPMETLVWTRGKTPSAGIYAIVPAVVKDGVVVVAQKNEEEQKMTREQLLREFPLKNNETGDVVDDFKDLFRIVSSQKMSPSDIALIHKEIIARREKQGRPAGRNRRKKVDGSFRYVSA